jgi:hypothetical protein
MWIPLMKMLEHSYEAIFSIQENLISMWYTQAQLPSDFSYFFTWWFSRGLKTYTQSLYISDGNSLGIRALM